MLYFHSNKKTWSDEKYLYVHSIPARVEPVSLEYWKLVLLYLETLHTGEITKIIKTERKCPILVHFLFSNNNL